MGDLRGGGLTGFAVSLCDVVLETVLAKMRTRVWISLISLGLVFIFGLMAIVFLFVLAYAALAKTYDTTTAAFVLFGVCIFICLGTLIVYRLSLSALKRKKLYTRAVTAETERDAQKLPPELFLGAEIGRLAENFFGNNLSTSLITSLLIGAAAIGYRPKTSIKIMSRLAGIKRRR